MSNRYDAVLFDFFDTLCRLDESIYREGKRRSAALVGLDPEAYFTQWLALQDQSQKGHLATAADRIQKVCSALGREIDPEFAGIVERHEQEVLLRCAALYPDAIPVLRRLRKARGLRIALVSNASIQARRLLAGLRLEGFFDVTTFSFEVGSVKPDPAIYLAACRALSVSPSRCLFVGDGNGRELEGAMEVGMTAVRIERPGAMEPYRREPSRRWHHSISELGQITGLLWDRQEPGGVSES